MECFKIENLSFTYPNRENKALTDINLTVKQGEFITLAENPAVEKPPCSVF